VADLFGPLVGLLLFPLWAAPQVLFGAKVFYAERLGEAAGERTLYVATVALLVAASAAGLALGGTGATGGTAPDLPAAEEADFEVTDDGTRYTVHPSRLRQGCPGGTDCIPSIDDPSYQPAGDAGWLAEEDLVIGVEVDGEPVRFSPDGDRLVDGAGNEWSFDGEALEGPHAGAELERRDLLASDGAVFVHCAVGVSRSVAVTTAALAARDGRPPDEVLDHVGTRG
jgi:hypothetical protein